MLFLALVVVYFAAALWAGLRHNLFAAIAGFAVMVVAFPWLMIVVAAVVERVAGQLAPDFARDVKSTLLLTGWAMLPAWFFPMIAGFLTGLMFRAERRRVTRLRSKEDL